MASGILPDTFVHDKSNKSNVALSVSGMVPETCEYDRSIFLKLVQLSHGIGPLISVPERSSTSKAKPVRVVNIVCKTLHVCFISSSICLSLPGVIRGMVPVVLVCANDNMLKFLNKDGGTTPVMFVYEISNTLPGVTSCGRGPDAPIGERQVDYCHGR